MNLYVGTSGYSYKEWKGSFYPEKIPAKEMLHLLRRTAQHRGNQRHVLSHASEKHAGKLEGASAAGFSLFTESPTARHPLSSG